MCFVFISISFPFRSFYGCDQADARLANQTTVRPIIRMTIYIPSFVFYFDLAFLFAFHYIIRRSRKNVASFVKIIKLIFINQKPENGCLRRETQFGFSRWKKGAPQ